MRCSSLPSVGWKCIGTGVRASDSSFVHFLLKRRARLQVIRHEWCVGSTSFDLKQAMSPVVHVMHQSQLVDFFQSL